MVLAIRAYSRQRILVHRCPIGRKMPTIQYGCQHADTSILAAPHYPVVGKLEALQIAGDFGQQKFDQSEKAGYSAGSAPLFILMTITVRSSSSDSR